MKSIAKSKEAAGLLRARRRNFASRSRRGQAGLFVVFNLTIVFGTLGLAVDVGWAYYTRQSAQAAADAAAMAAVSWASSSGKPVCGTGGVTCNSTATACSNPPTTPATTDLQVACLYAQQNGFVNNGTTQFVTMAGNTTAPPGITNNSPSYWVQANVTAKPYTFFGAFGGVKQFTVNASAIAAVTYNTPGACIYVLDPSVAQAFSATGASTTTATCGIFVNSNSSSAFYEHGSPSVTASQILINGGASISGSSSVSPNPPTTNAGPVSDPLANLSLPTFSNMCPNPPYAAYTLAGTSVATQGGTRDDGSTEGIIFHSPGEGVQHFRRRVSRDSSGGKSGEISASISTDRISVKTEDTPRRDSFRLFKRMDSRLRGFLAAVC